MRVIIKLIGTSPLLMHNAQLSDPEHPISRAIAELTSKVEKTAEDHREISRLEFCGSLYVGKGGPVMPAANLQKCFSNAAKIRREGKSVERALLPVGLDFPLQYSGPRTAEELWADDTYHFRVPVRVGRARVMRMRPRFPVWGIESEWELVDDMFDLSKLKRCGNEAGLVEGLGDARNKGFGRFTCEIIQAMRAAA